MNKKRRRTRSNEASRDGSTSVPGSVGTPAPRSPAASASSAGMSAAAQAARIGLLKHPWGWLATGFGAGLARGAPGTIGSAVALIPYLLMREYAWWLVWPAIVIVFVLGILASRWTIARLQREDPGEIVVDEFVGQWLTLAMMDLALRFAPGKLYVPSLFAFVAVGVAAFRLCDITKPWPASWADRTVHGGLGAMLDDVLAALWAGLIGILALYVAAMLFSP
jgi:phosphatidylglycerophosphatase A